MRVLARCKAYRSFQKTPDVCDAQPHDKKGYDSKRGQLPEPRHFLAATVRCDGDGDKTASGTASGTIMLIDTAGQEEVDQQSRADPAEVTSINISLADLGRCLKLLWEQRRRGPVAARATEF